MSGRWLAVAGLLAAGCAGSASPPAPAAPGAAGGGTAAAPPAPPPPAPPAEPGPPIIIVPQPIAPAAGEWTQVGPGGGSMSQVAVKPDDPRVALAVGRRTVFRTTDGGARWQSVAMTPEPYIGFQSVTFSAVNPAHAWAADYSGRIYASVDGGGNWSISGQQLPIPVPQLVADPLDADAVYAATSGGLYVSRDGGKFWSVLFVPPHQLGESYEVCGLVFDPFAPATIYTGRCDYNYGTGFRSTDAGKSWTALKTGFGNFTAFSVDPRVRGRVFASIEFAGGEVLVSNDGGNSWGPQDAYGNIPFSARSLSVAGDGTVYAALRFPGIFASHDGGNTFAADGIGIPDRSATFVALDPLLRTPLFAAVAELEGGGVYRATSSGWQRTTSGLFAEGVPSLAWSSQGALYAATDGGLFVSPDGGSTWSQLTDQFTNSIAIDGQDALYLADYLTVRKSSDGGHSWTTLSSAAAETRLVANPLRPGELYGYGWTLQHSTDGGATWTRLGDGGFSAFAADFRRPGRVYTWAQDLHRDPSSRDIVYLPAHPGLRASTDSGGTWTPTQALGASDAAGIVVSQGLVFAALLEKDSREIVTAATVQRSDDGGATWHEVLRRSEAIQGIAVDGTSVLVKLPDGTLRSTDAGKTWSRVGAGNAVVTGLAVSPDGAIYATTADASLQRLAR